MSRPDYTREQYHCREHVIVHYRREPNRYLFEFVDRKDILIDGKAPEEIMDQLMIEMGDTLYPLCLYVNHNGEILKVSCFEEVRDRWIKKTGELMQKHDTAPFKKYVQTAQRNMKTEEAFRKALTKNSFFKFYFLPDRAESFMHEVHHFPGRSDMTLFLFERNRKGMTENGESLSYTARSVFPEKTEISGLLNRRFSESGDLELLKVELNWEDTEGMPYRKTITLRVDEKKRDILGANKFWSFILD